ncbi:MAG TPA: DUF2334 domain-containing protein [Verrucomicrobiae bacterium]|nr:DUF2334 domain-containing protein [Verrucomicrobiae bacterium]
MTINTWNRRHSQDPAPPAAAEPSVTVVFRYDDYCGKRNFDEADVELLLTFRRRGVPLTLGVTPYVCAENPRDRRPQPFLVLGADQVLRAKELLAMGLCEVALHGYTHQTVTEGPPNSEFAGVPFARQGAALRKGRRLLERDFGVRVTTFIPPWNSYDAATVLALERLGFNALSGALVPPFPSGSRVRFVPEMCLLTEVEGAVDAALRWGGDSLVVVMFHGYDFREADPVLGRTTLAQLEALLGELQRDPRVRFATLSEAASSLPHLDAGNARRNLDLLRPGLQDLLPRRLRVRPLFIPDPRELERCSGAVARRLCATLVVWYGAALAAGLATLCALYLAIGRLPAAHLGAAALGLVGVAGAALSARRLPSGQGRYRVATILVCVAPVLADAALLYLRRAGP